MLLNNFKKYVIFKMIRLFIIYGLFLLEMLRNRKSLLLENQYFINSTFWISTPQISFRFFKEPSHVSI